MKIKGSAIRIGEFVHWGITIHTCLLSELFDMGRMPKPSVSQMTRDDWDYIYMDIGYEEGFVLEDDSFVDRYEAANIAVETQQIESKAECYRRDELHLPDVYHALA